MSHSHLARPSSGVPGREEREKQRGRTRKSPRIGVPAGPGPRRHHRWVRSAAGHAGPCRRIARRFAPQTSMYVPSGPAGPIGHRNIGRCRCLAIGNISRGCDRFNPPLFHPCRSGPSLRVIRLPSGGREALSRTRPVPPGIRPRRAAGLVGLGVHARKFSGSGRSRIREPELRDIHPLVGGIPAPDFWPSPFSGWPCPSCPSLAAHAYPSNDLMNSSNSSSSHLTRTPGSSISGSLLSLVSILPVSGSIPSVTGR